MEWRDLYSQLDACIRKYSVMPHLITQSRDRDGSVTWRRADLAIRMKAKWAAMVQTLTFLYKDVEVGPSHDVPMTELDVIGLCIALALDGPRVALAD
jgi:hypothetical protein